MASAPAGSFSGFPGLVGQSGGMMSVFDSIRRCADSLAPVYLLGETGTGKEQVARAIHEASRRGGQPFVAVNAAAVSDDLLDSEMFGHRRGAFTGAVADRTGYVAAAHGGTLLVDEVADLSPRAQIKLLRFLQEKEYRRVGETEVRKADVRVIAATHTSLEERVRTGGFRRDLLFRLNVLKLVIPPLRARPEDIPVLAAHFLQRSAAAEAKPLPTLSLAAVRALQTHDWPGNVRELQGEMHRAVVYYAGRTVQASDLSLERGRERTPAVSDLAQAVSEFERDYVARALAECGGHRTKAARLLGISRQGLQLKMKRLGIGDKDYGGC